MRRSRIVTYIVFASLALFACKKEKEETPVEEESQVELNLLPMFQSDTLELDSTITLSSGFKMQVTDIKCYFYGLQHNGKQLIQAALFDYRDRGFQVFKTSANYLDFSGLSGLLGVDTAVNHDDPAAFPNSSPLNIANAGEMHWGWNPGYIFIKFEARADTIPDGNDVFNHYLVYHIGTDTYLSNLSFPNMNWQMVSTKLHRAQLRLQVDQLFDNVSAPIDIRSEYMSHSGSGVEALTEKFRSNFVEALSAQ
jgi:hypothetical protein